MSTVAQYSQQVVIVTMSKLLAAMGFKPTAYVVIMELLLYITICQLSLSKHQV